MKKFAFLLICIATIYSCRGESKILNLEPLNTLRDIIKSDYDPKISNLRGLINSLNAYAKNTSGLVRLAPPLSDIYNAVNDIYKALYEADKKLYKNAATYTNGAADRFLQALIFSIVSGNFDDYLLPITASLKAEYFDLSQQVKEEKTGY